MRPLGRTRVPPSAARGAHAAVDWGPSCIDSRRSPPTPHTCQRNVNVRHPCVQAWVVSWRTSVIVLQLGGPCRNRPRSATCRGSACSQRWLERRRCRASSMESGSQAPGGAEGRPVAAGWTRGTPKGSRSRRSPTAARKHTGFAAAMEASRTAGNPRRWSRDAPAIGPLAGLPPIRETSSLLEGRTAKSFDTVWGETVSKPSAEGLPLFPAAARLHGNAAFPA
jgi:hypothetical protein